jgi:DNA-3-methyladenine glycosylase
MTEPHAILPPALGPSSCSSTPRNFTRIERDELPVDSVALARFLLGMVLVREPSTASEQRVAATIVETEAYLPGDAGSHAFRGRTARNGAMFGERGRAYVYFIYGNHYCLNVVSESEGVGGAVLLRAAAPLEGEPTMRARSGDRVDARDLLRGPGRLARAFGIDKRFDGADLCGDSPLRLARDVASAGEHAVGTSVRIGLTKNAEAPLRFFLRGHPLLSGPKRLAAN